jgi:hypothetical protein
MPRRTHPEQGSALVSHSIYQDSTPPTQRTLSIAFRLELMTAYNGLSATQLMSVGAAHDGN